MTVAYLLSMLAAFAFYHGVERRVLSLRARTGPAPDTSDPRPRS